MKKQTIVLFDDDERRARDWSSRLKKISNIRSSFEIKVLNSDKFQDNFTELQNRRKEARNKKTKQNAPNDIDIDEASILVIDYDLFALKDSSYITGEMVAYLSRCYSNCGLIVALNAYGRSPFDLTLKGHPESFADLNIGDTQIHSPGLWQEPWRGFRPWSWPLLPKALDSFYKRTDEVFKALDTPILSFLDLKQFAGILPRSVIEYIEASGERKPEETTFREFVNKSQQGLKPGDKVSDLFIARIAAARIYKWLERLILSGQDILVDAPHLVARFPSLLKGDLKMKSTWNRVASLKLLDRSVMNTAIIDSFRFSKANWVSRPCWFYGELSSYEKVAEVKNPWSEVEKADLVFCEDVSTFADRSKAKEFVANLPSPFARRYVLGNAEGVVYHPVSSFAK